MSGNMHVMHFDDWNPIPTGIGRDFHYTSAAGAVFFITAKKRCIVTPKRKTKKSFFHTVACQVEI